MSAFGVKRTMVINLKAAKALGVARHGRRDDRMTALFLQRRMSAFGTKRTLRD